jgi:glycosyltransferase involved in cell wall biosynthesis
VLLLPRRYGGLSLPMMEALSCGIPVLMTDADPQRAVLPPGMLVRSHESRRFQGQSGIIPLSDADVPTLAARLDALSRDAGAVERLSKEADLLAEAMSWEHVAAGWFALLDRLGEGLAD